MGNLLHHHHQHYHDYGNYDDDDDGVKCDNDNNFLDLSLGQGDEGKFCSGLQINQLRVWSWLANLFKSVINIISSSNWYHTFVTKFKFVSRSQKSPELLSGCHGYCSSSSSGGMINDHVH